MNPDLTRALLGAVLFVLLWAALLRTFANLFGGMLARNELYLLSFLASASLISVIGLLLAFSGLLILPILAVAVGGSTIALVALPGGKSPPPSGTGRPPLHRTVILQAIPFLVLIAGGIFLYFHPDENIAGNWDPGVYLSQGAALARGGSYRFTDTASPELTGEEKELFYPRQGSRQAKVPGFFVSKSRAHRLDPQFYPLYPLWIAVVTLFGGFSASLFAGSVYSLLSLMLVMKIGEDLSGRTCAFASGLVFLLNPFQIWFSGFHTAEVPMQTLFLAGLWCRLLYRREGHRLLAFLAGTFIALTAFAGITGLLLAALAGILNVIATRRPGELIPYFLPYLLLAPLALWQNLSFSSQYISQAEVFLPAFRSAVANPWLIGPTALGLLLLLSVRLGRKERNRRYSRAVSGAGLVLLTGALVALVAKTLYFGGFEESRFILAAVVTSKSNLLFAFVGFCLLLWLRPGAGLSLGALSFAFTYLFSESLMMESLFPWAAKRFIVVTLPVLSLAVGLFWARALGLFRGCGMGVILILLMLSFSLRPLYRGWDFAYHRDWGGLVPFVEKVANRIPDDSIVLAPRWIATPLDFIHGKTVIPLYLPGEGRRSAEAYGELVGRLRSEEKRVILVGERDDLRRLPLDGEPLFRDNLFTSVLEQSRRPPAGKSRPRTIAVEVVEVR